MTNQAAFRIRNFRAGDEAAANYVCLKTGDHGRDGESFYREDPDALGRIYVEPYLRFEPNLALILEDQEGVCGYALGAQDTAGFYQRYDCEFRSDLVGRFPCPQGNPSQWSRTEQVYHLYHHPDYHIPEPRNQYPSHLHIDLLERAQGQGQGRIMMETLLDKLRSTQSAGVHLGMNADNDRAYTFYRKLGFQELERAGEGFDACIYMGLVFQPL